MATVSPGTALGGESESDVTDTGPGVRENRSLTGQASKTPKASPAWAPQPNGWPEGRCRGSGKQPPRGRSWTAPSYPRPPAQCRYTGPVASPPSLTLPLCQTGVKRMRPGPVAGQMKRDNSVAAHGSLPNAGFQVWGGGSLGLSCLNTGEGHSLCSKLLETGDKCNRQGFRCLRAASLRNH